MQNFGVYNNILPIHTRGLHIGKYLCHTVSQHLVG